jgi:hypothetical protein
MLLLLPQQLLLLLLPPHLPLLPLRLLPLGNCQVRHRHAVNDKPPAPPNAPPAPVAYRRAVMLV